MRATPKTSLPVCDCQSHGQNKKSGDFDIPSPARGPRETFSLAAAGAFLVGAIATVGWSWRGWNTELKKEEEEMDEKKVDVCPRLQVDADWLIGPVGKRDAD